MENASKGEALLKNMEGDWKNLLWHLKWTNQRLDVCSCVRRNLRDCFRNAQTENASDCRLAKWMCGILLHWKVTEHPMNITSIAQKGHIVLGHTMMVFLFF